MGLLLSKEVRERVADEKAMRKSAFNDFDTKVRQFIQQTLTATNQNYSKLQKRMTSVARAADLTEKSCKRGIGSVAEVVRSLQPALDGEIQARPRRGDPGKKARGANRGDEKRWGFVSMFFEDVVTSSFII